MPLLILSKSNPLRWASVWFWVAAFVELRLYEKKHRFLAVLFYYTYLSCASQKAQQSLPLFFFTSGGR